MINKIVATMALLPLCLMANSIYASSLEQQCKGLLDQTLHVWTMSSVRPDVRKWAEDEKEDPVRLYGDFNGDGRKDIALLIQKRVKSTFDEPTRIYATRVAVCFNKKSSMVLHLIKKTYCDDDLFLINKGDEMQDSDGINHGKYPVDAIGTDCYEKADASFYWDGKKFVQLVTGD